MAANWLGLDLNAYASVSLPYTDTKDIPSWDLNAVKALYELGIMQGSRANDGPCGPMPGPPSPGPRP